MRRTFVTLLGILWLGFLLVVFRMDAVSQKNDTKRDPHIDLYFNREYTYTVFKDQDFVDSKGVARKGDTAVGIDPKTFTPGSKINFGAIRSSKIDAYLKKPNVSAGLPTGSTLELRGWLEHYTIQEIDMSLPKDQSQLRKMTALLLHAEKIYILEFLPDCKYKMPKGDDDGDAFNARVGQEHQYLIKGISGGTFSVMMYGVLPILYVSHFERKK